LSIKRSRKNDKNNKNDDDQDGQNAHNSSTPWSAHQLLLNHSLTTECPSSKETSGNQTHHNGSPSTNSNGHTANSTSTNLNSKLDEILLKEQSPTQEPVTQGNISFCGVNIVKNELDCGRFDASQSGTSGSNSSGIEKSPNCGETVVGIVNEDCTQEVLPVPVVPSLINVPTILPLESSYYEPRYATPNGGKSFTPNKIEAPLMSSYSHSRFSGDTEVASLNHKSGYGKTKPNSVTFAQFEETSLKRKAKQPLRLEDEVVIAGDNSRTKIKKGKQAKLSQLEFKANSFLCK